MTTSRCPSAPVLAIRRLAPLALLLAAAALPAAERAPQAFAVIVAGESGEPGFAATYRDWTIRLHALLTARCGVPADHVAVLVEAPDALPGVATGRSTREVVSATIAATIARIAPGDQLVIALMGHGTDIGGAAKLCLPGADLAADELAALLAGCPTREVVLLDAAAGGHAFVAACSLPGRVAISATNGAGEGNEAYLLEFLLRAGEAAADADLLSWFNQAAMDCPKWYFRQYLTKTKPQAWQVQGRASRELWVKFYGQVPGKLLAPVENPDEPDAEPELGEWGPQWHGRRMLAEHAQLDDNGDRVGACVFVENRLKPLAPAAETDEGWTAQRTRIGHPRGDTRPPPAPLPVDEPAR